MAAWIEFGGIAADGTAVAAGTGAGPGASGLGGTLYMQVILWVVVYTRCFSTKGEVLAMEFLWQSRGSNKRDYEQKHRAKLETWLKSYTVSVDDAARPLDLFLQEFLVAGIDDSEDDRVRQRPGLVAAGEMISSGPLRDDHWVRGGVVPEDRDWGADPNAVAAIPCTPYLDVLEKGRPWYSAFPPFMRRLQQTYGHSSFRLKRRNMKREQLDRRCILEVRPSWNSSNSSWTNFSSTGT